MAIIISFAKIRGNCLNYKPITLQTASVDIIQKRREKIKLTHFEIFWDVILKKS